LGWKINKRERIYIKLRVVHCNLTESFWKG